MAIAGEAKAARAGEKRERCIPEVRRKGILAAAHDVFLERGYVGATIDAVVERAGGSKATVYAMFGNKEGLFAALIAELAETFAEATRQLGPGSSVAESLRSLGRTYLELVLSEERLAMLRLVAGESGRLPQLGDVFYRLGPRCALTLFTELFRDWMGRGLVAGKSAESLASHFLGALRGDLFLRSLLNPTRAPTKKEIAEHVDGVVATLLSGCAPDKGSS
jgi:TetR/AcrR family transcriptional regulator, mexJK operon transcriptional repressor